MEEESNEVPSDEAQLVASRPVGASAIGCLALFGSALGLGGMMWVVSQEGLGDRVAELGGLMSLVGPSLVVILALTLATGVGLFADRPWGWWVAGTTLGFACMRSMGAVVQLLVLAEELPAITQDRLGIEILKHTVRVAFNVWLVAYLTRDHVRAYYRVPDSRALALRKVAAASVSLYVALALFNWILAQLL